jgi:hypothetical protein
MGGGFAVGLLAGLALPVSEVERDIAAEATPRGRRVLGEAAQAALASALGSTAPKERRQP